MGDSPETRRTKLNIESQALENQKSRDFQHAENEIDRNFQREQWNDQFLKMNNEWDRRFDIENKYNQPQAQIARLMAAGINPAALVSQLTGVTGTMSPTAPSAPSPSSGGHGVGFGTITPSPFSTDAAIFSSLAQLNDSLSKTVQTGLNVNEQRKMLGERVKNVIADTATKDAQTTHQQILNDIDNALGKDKVAAEIKDLINGAYEKMSSGDAHSARAEFDRAQSLLSKQQHRFNEQQFPQLLANLKKTGSLIDEQAKTEKSKQEENRASAEEHRSSANLLDAKALTEDQIRIPSLQKLANENKVTKSQLRQIKVQTVEEMVKTVDSVFGHDSGFGAYLKAAFVNANAAERKRVLESLIDLTK